MFTLKKYLYDIAYGQRKVKNRLGIVVMLISGYAGYNIGTNQSEKLDTSSLYQFNGQDEEIYNLLQTKPVLQLIYPPGEPYFDNYRTAFIKASNKFKYKMSILQVKCTLSQLTPTSTFNIVGILIYQDYPKDCFGYHRISILIKLRNLNRKECFLLQNILRSILQKEQNAFQCRMVLFLKKSTDKLTQQIKPLM